MWDLHHEKATANFVDLLKKELPMVDINENDFNIATSEESFDPNDGFWDIKEKRQPTGIFLRGYASNLLTRSGTVWV